jgi:predicted nucleic acid-binding protein
MSVLLDTTIVIDLLRGYSEAHRYAGTLQEPPACSEITRVEVLRGQRTGERRTTERLLGAFEWVGVDESIARRAGIFGRSLSRSHPGIAISDLIVAATAEEIGLPLATLNVKHIPMFLGLRPPY